MPRVMPFRMPWLLLMLNHALPVLAQDAEQSSDLRTCFEHIVNGSIVGLVGASVTGRLAEDGGLADLRLANQVRHAVQGLERRAPAERQDAGGLR